MNLYERHENLQTPMVRRTYPTCDAMKRVVVHIDRLVLKGFRQEDRQVVAEGLQQELARLFAEPGAATRLSGLGDIHRLRVNNLALRDGVQPGEIGEAGARGIGRELLP